MSSQRREVRPAITFCCATLQRELTTLKSGRECAGASHRPQSRASDPPDLETRHHRKYSSEEVPSGSELVILSGSGVGQHYHQGFLFELHIRSEAFAAHGRRAPTLLGPESQLL